MKFKFSIKSDVLLVANIVPLTAFWDIDEGKNANFYKKLYRYVFA
jgi:hypothetical protein